VHQGVANENFRTQTDGPERGRDKRVSEILEGFECDLNNLVQGLGLLGLRRCSQCKRFFRSSDPGALFTAVGALVCFECIPVWWPLRREQLSCMERQNTERQLVFWLRNFHDARSYKGSGKVPDDQTVKFELMANCLECRGTGTYLGDKRCRYCAGPGTVRVIVPEKPR